MGGSINNTKGTNPYTGRSSSILSRIKSTKNPEAIGFLNPLVPMLPKALSGHALVLTNNNKLMIIGGNTLTGINAIAMNTYTPKSGKICYILENGHWRCHSMLSERRSKALAMSMPNGIYVFGGSTCEFLPNEASKWTTYTDVPKPGFANGHGLAISSTELLLTGGSFETIEKQILRFNTKTKEWQSAGEMLEKRSRHSSFLFKNNVIVTGGLQWQKYTGRAKVSIAITEMLALPDLKPRKAGDLITARHNHGMGLVKIKGKYVLIAFGGCKIDASGKRELLSSIEEWNEEEEKWVLSKMTLSEAKEEFGYCSMLPNLQ